MKQLFYHPDERWYNPEFRGNTIGVEHGWADADMVDDQYCYATHKGGIIYPEHNDDYLHECINLLKEKQAPIDWEKVEEDLWK